MNRLSNAITRAMALTLTFSQSAFAKVCAVHNQEAEMGAGTLGQYLTLGVMLTLVTGIFIVKWVYKKELDSFNSDAAPEADNTAAAALKQLKIGQRFSNWSHMNRLNLRKPLISDSK